MPSNEEKSYTASIKVDRVIRRAANTSSVPTRGSTTRREIESFRLTVRAPTLEKLNDKIKAHLALIDDEDFGDDTVKRGSDDTD